MVVSPPALVLRKPRALACPKAQADNRRHAKSGGYAGEADASSAWLAQYDAPQVCPFEGTTAAIR